MASVHLGWLGVILSLPRLHIFLTSITSWKWQITKDNRIKLLKEFCGLRYLNSPEFLYNQLLIFFFLQMARTQDDFKACSPLITLECSFSDCHVQDQCFSLWKFPIHTVTQPAPRIVHEMLAESAQWQQSSTWFFWVVAGFIHSFNK